MSVHCSLLRKVRLLGPCCVRLSFDHVHRSTTLFTHLSVLRDSDALQVGRVILKFRAEGAYEIPTRDDDEGEGSTGAPAVLGLPTPKSRN